MYFRKIYHSYYTASLSSKHFIDVKKYIQKNTKRAQNSQSINNSLAPGGPFTTVSLPVNVTGRNLPTRFSKHRSQSGEHSWYFPWQWLKKKKVASIPKKFRYLHYSCWSHCWNKIFRPKNNAIPLRVLVPAVFSLHCGLREEVMPNTAHRLLHGGQSVPTSQVPSQGEAWTWHQKPH